MKNLITTIEEVSKEVKNKISKLGKEVLVVKYISGSLDTQEKVIAARHYINKRGVENLTPATIAAIDLVNTSTYDKLFDVKSTPSATTKTTTFGKHRSQMSEDQVIEADTKNAKTIDENKKKRQLTESQQQIVDTAEVLNDLKGLKKDKKAVKTEVAKEEKVSQMKLTAQEFTLFEQIKVSKSVELNQFQEKFTSLREFKGVLSSLAKKDIISYDQDEFKILPLGASMISGELSYKEKNKHEQNDFKKARIVIEIDGKMLEKSAYVRQLLRKNNKITCADLNVTLAKAGFPKLYHSELQRCKEQLGIVTVKDKD